jgi:hypothetical protein
MSEPSEKKMTKFWKLARPDGWDFYTGKTINYRENIGREIICPKFNASGKLCSSAFIHASRTPNQCFVGASIPCSVYYVKGKPIIEDNDKCGFERLFIVKELQPEKVFEWNYAEAINPINPFKLPMPEITEQHIGLIKKWSSVSNSVETSVRDSVWSSVCASVRDSVWTSVWTGVRDNVWDGVWTGVRDSVWDGVWDGVWDSVQNSVWANMEESVWNSVRDGVWDSMWAYIGSLFPLPRTAWKYTEKIKCKGYPFQPAIDLWKAGLVSSFDGKTWRLHGGPDGKVLWEGGRR